MANAYKSFYFSDIKEMIQAAALKIMCVPMFDENDPSCDRHNANIAIYNDGIRTFADVLIDKLTEEAAEEEKADDNT